MKRLVALLTVAALLPASVEAQRGLRWVLTTDHGASLDLMRPGIDVPVLEFICTDGRQVEISVNFRRPVTGARINAEDEWVDQRGRVAPWPARMTIASGSVSETYPATLEPGEGEEAMGSYVIATIDASEPVLSAFARTGQIRFTYMGELNQPPPVPTVQAARLVAACRR